MEVDGVFQGSWYLFDTYTSNIIPNDWGGYLTFVDQYNSNIKFNSFSNILSWIDMYHPNTYANSNTDMLAFTDGFYNNFNTIITANWQIQDQYNATINYWQDTYSWTDRFGTVNNVEITLAWTDQYNSSVEHAGQWLDYMAWNPNSNFNRPYSLFIGHNDTCDTDPIHSYVSFTFEDQTITLDNPLIGDIDNLIYTRTDAKSRTGNLIILSEPYWPKLRQLELQFTWIHPDTAKTLVTFIENTAGLQLTFVDWYGKIWYGLIINPDAELIQQLHGFSVTYTFEGSLSTDPLQL